MTARTATLLSLFILLPSCDLQQHEGRDASVSAVCPNLKGEWEALSGTCFFKGPWADATQDGCTVTFGVDSAKEPVTADVTAEGLAFVVDVGKGQVYDCQATFGETTTFDAMTGECSVTGWTIDKCTFSLKNKDPRQQPPELTGGAAGATYTAGNDPALCQQMCTYLASACPAALATGMQGCVDGCIASPIGFRENDLVCLQSLGNCQDPLHVCDRACSFDCECASGNRVTRAQWVPRYGGCPPADGYCPVLCRGAAK